MTAPCPTKNQRSIPSFPGRIIYASLAAGCSPQHGIHLSAGKGSGKSTIMGRIIAWQDFIRGTPQVIFDPHGQPSITF